jgi:hypothetical protein
MQMSRKHPVKRKSKTRIIRHTLAFVTMAVATLLLQGCGGGSSSAYVTLTANNPAPNIQLVSVQISPTTPLIGLAEKRQLSATGVYSDGSTNNITSQVTWRSSSAPSSTDYVVVNPSGLATATAVGATVVTASLGPVTGALQLTADTNGFASGTTAILSVPFKSVIVDAAYLPQSLTKNQGAFAVQEVNLDADQFASALPVPVALLASIPMPAAFIPNITVADQSDFLVVALSYSSAQVQIIDASNLSSDVANNTVINTFTAPISQSVSFYAGTPQAFSCMICAAIFNPATGKLLLSTAEGYYAMDPFSGTFTALPFTPAPAPSPNLSLNPIATPNPYVLATNPTTGDIQILNLTTNAVTTVSASAVGVTTPGAAVIDPLTNYAAVVDAATGEQSLLNVAAPQSPVPSPLVGLGVCGAPEPANLNMVAMGISANAVQNNTAHTLFTSQTSGNCVGFEAPWPTDASQPLLSSAIFYGYGSMPATPDSQPFINGNDANAIAAFNSVYDQNNYGLLVDANQQWVAKIKIASVLSDAGIGAGNGSAAALPGGTAMSSGTPSGILCAYTEVNLCVTYNTIIYLPAPSVSVTLSVSSISFGSLSVGTPSASIPVTVDDIGAAILTDQISIQGANASDFSLLNSCALQLQPHATCGLSVIFTPSAKGARSATLTVAVTGSSTQSIPLSGTGT